MRYADTDEHACSEDAAHDIDGSEANDDELDDEPNADAAAYDPDDPSTWDPARRPWKITSDSTADWALAKVKRARWEVDRITDRADDEARRVVEWRANASAGSLRDIAFFEDHLIAYRRSVTPAKGKTYRLLNGELKASAGSEHVEVDEDVFVDWAEGNGRLDLIEHKPQPKKAAIKEALKQGEVIPGARLVVGDERFTVVTGGGEPPAVLPMPEPVDA